MVFLAGSQGWVGFVVASSFAMAEPPMSRAAKATHRYWSFICITAC